MKKSNFALRLQPSLMEETRKVAKAEGVAVNQLINVAVAEKLSALRTEEYFAERAARGDVTRALHHGLLIEPESGTGPFQVTSSRFVDHGDAPLGHQGSGGEVGHGETSPQDGITRPGFARARRATRARAAGCG